MAAAALPSSGARRARFPRDIPPITELVELCFADVLDYSSRRMLRDVRTVAQWGRAAWSLSRMLGAVNPEEWLLASVWEEEGRIVGNATLTRRLPEAHAWLVSNVAVHPEYRGRGIAGGLIRHALEEIRRRGGRNVYLQVDASNEAAVRIYRGLGFEEIARRTTWLRAREESRTPAPDEPASACRVSRRTPAEWMEEYAFWREISPDGTAWNSPLTEKRFHPSLCQWLERMLEGESEAHFLARCGPRVEGALAAYRRYSGWEGVLIQREGSEGRVEGPLLDAAGKAFPRERSVLLETTPEASVGLLVQLGFQKRRTFIWMRYTFSGGAP